MLQIQTTITKAISGIIGKGGSRMWGFSLAFWESVFFWATGLAALAGAVSVMSAFVAGIVGYQVADVVQKENEVKIADSNARAESAKLSSAEANARAAEANLALEKFKAPRFLSTQEIQLIVSRVSKFAGQEYEVTPYWDSKESLDFSNQLHESLTTAGWKYLPHGSGSMLFAGTAGVQVWVHPNADISVKNAADSLVSTLNELAKAPVLRMQDAATPNDNRIRLNIGTKY